MKLDEILASWENRPEAFTGQKVDTATFIGPNSQAWESGAYQQALEMEKKGVSPKEIWQRTGTGRSIDGKWRQEISDNEASLKDFQAGDTITDLGTLTDPGGVYRTPVTAPIKIEDFLNIGTNLLNERDGSTSFARNEGTLGELLDHDKLGDAYPGLLLSRANLNVEGSSPGLKGRHYLDNPGFTDVGRDIANEATIKENRQPQQAQRWRDDFIRDKYNPNKSKEYDPKWVEKLYDNMSKGNVTLYGSKDGNRSREGIFDTLLHENQHNIQEIEGFGTGHGGMIDNIYQNNSGLDIVKDWTQSKGVDYDKLPEDLKRHLIYMMQPGEAEARATSRRMNLNDTQRKQNFPFEQTVSMGDAIEGRGNNTYGYDVPVGVARDLWEYNNPNSPQAPTVLPGAKAGTPVNRPRVPNPEPVVEPHDQPIGPRVDVAPPEQEPFIPTEPDFTKRPGYVEPETIVDLPDPTQRPYSTTTLGIPVNPNDPENTGGYSPQDPVDTGGHEGHHHGEEHETTMQPQPAPKIPEGFDWGRLFDGDMSIEETWDAIPGTDIEDWKKKMPPVGEGVGGFMKEEEINELIKEMIRNGKIRSNR